METLTKTPLEIEMEERERESNSVPKTWHEKNIFDDKDVLADVEKTIEDKCECGKPSTKGCHGVADGDIFSIYYCDECYNERYSKGSKDEDDESEVSDAVQEN